MTKNQIKAMMLSAAVTGLLGAAPMALNAQPVSTTTVTPVQAMLGAFAKSSKTKVEKHACKGQNNCKGQGGCKSGNNGCKGKNSCKGKGGCNTEHPM
ncbi:MAG: hypothetical protein ACP5M4_03755 [Acidobacteriaceae bacterium]